MTNSEIEQQQIATLKDFSPDLDPQRVRSLMETKEFRACSALSELRSEIDSRKKAGEEIGWITEKLEMIDSPARVALSEKIASQGWKRSEFSAALMISIGHVRLPDPQ